MNKDLQIKNLQLENYRLHEKIVTLENKLEWITEAIQSVESEYRLKQHIKEERISSKYKLEAIKEIRQQCELIKLREKTQ